MLLNRSDWFEESTSGRHAPEHVRVEQPSAIRGLVVAGLDAVAIAIAETNVELSPQQAVCRSLEVPAKHAGPVLSHPESLRLLKESVLQIWKARKTAVRDGLGEAERAAKAIQEKLDRLEEAFLFEPSIDIEVYDRHAEKLHEELTLGRIDRHSGQLEELDVEGILALQNAFCHAPRTCGSRRHSNNASGSNNCSFRTESRSTEIGLLEPAQPHRLSATCGKSEPK